MATLADARLSKTALRTLSPAMNKDPEVRRLPGELRGAVRQSLSRGLERFRRAADHVGAHQENIGPLAKGDFRVEVMPGCVKITPTTPVDLIASLFDQRQG